MVRQHRYILLFFIIFCFISIAGCNLYFPPKSAEDLIPAVTPLPTPAPVPTPLPTPSLPPDGNMIWNGDFEAGMSNWTYWVYTDAGTAASISAPAGVLDVIITEGMDTDWYIQVNQKFLDIIQMKSYTLTFYAWAEADRNIRAELGEDGIDNNNDGNNYTSYGSQTFSITATSAMYTAGFTMTETTDLNGRLTFSLGNSDYDVHIDNVTLKENP